MGHRRKRTINIVLEFQEIQFKVKVDNGSLLSLVSVWRSFQEEGAADPPGQSEPERQPGHRRV